MSDKAASHWIRAGVGGGVAGAAAWFVINRSWTINDVGILERQGWPWAAVYLWAAAGVALGMIGEAIRARRARHDRRQLEDLSAELGLAFSPHATTHDLREWMAIPLFNKWSAARNHLSGRVGGVHVEVVDYTYIERGHENDSTYHQTLALLVAADSGLPDFELRPRSVDVRLMGLLGLKGIQFSTRSTATANGEAIERFHKNYYLSEGSEAQAAKHELGALASNDNEAAICRRFGIEVLRFFADHPGWWIQCARGRLALGKPRKIVPPMDRLQFIEEAMAIRNALSASAAGAPLELAVDSGDLHPPQMAKSRAAAALIGGVCGFFGGGIVGGFLAGWIFFNLEHDGGPAFFLFFFLEAAVFFGGAFGGLFLGMIAGTRLLTRPIGRIVARRGDSLTLRNGQRDPQAIDNQSAAHDRDLEAVIEVRAPGLVGGCGCFVFGWSILWNLFMLVATPIFLVSAFQGEMVNEANGEPVHPAMMILFLIPFWVIGLTSLGFIVKRGRRGAVVRVSNDKLVIEESGAFGARRYEWPRTQLAGVHVVQDSSCRPRLLIQCAHQSPVEVLGYRSKPELDLIAKTITERMNLDSVEPQGDASSAAAAQPTHDAPG
jgi:hypothetical protein